MALVVNHARKKEAAYSDWMKAHVCLKNERKWCRETSREHERRKARVLIRAECSYLTEEQNKIDGGPSQARNNRRKEVRRQENVIKKEMRRASAGGI